MKIDKFFSFLINLITQIYNSYQQKKLRKSLEKASRERIKNDKEIAEKTAKIETTRQKINRFNNLMDDD